MELAGIDYIFDGLDIVSSSELDGKKVSGEKYDYLLRKSNNIYKVKKLSNTRNANVIFSIKLLDYDISQKKYDALEFEKAIKK